MASPTVLSGIAGGNALDIGGQFAAGRQDRLQEDAFKQNQQQRNVLFSQSQQDRETAIAAAQKEKALEPVREDLAVYLHARRMSPEAGQQVWAQLAPKYGFAATSNPDEVLPQVIQKNPGILGPATGKVLEEFFAPKEQTGFSLNPGENRYDASGKLIATGPAKTAPQARELWGAPVDEVGPDGKPIRVRYSNTGGRQIVTGAKPVNKVSTGAPTEDERKAAGWFNQAENAFKNMESAIAESGVADKPGIIETFSPSETLANATRSPARQRYVQAASSFSEAALRAATGAGVTAQEANQKIRELTPQLGDSKEVRAQKRASLQVYLGSLKQRAARALQQQANQAQQPEPQQQTYYYSGYGDSQSVLDQADAILRGQ